MAANPYLDFDNFDDLLAHVAPKAATLDRKPDAYPQDAGERLALLSRIEADVKRLQGVLLDTLTAISDETSNIDKTLRANSAKFADVNIAPVTDLRMLTTFGFVQPMNCDFSSVRCAECGSSTKTRANSTQSSLPLGGSFTKTFASQAWSNNCQKQSGRGLAKLLGSQTNDKKHTSHYRRFFSCVFAIERNCGYCLGFCATCFERWTVCDSD